MKTARRTASASCSSRGRPDDAHPKAGLDARLELRGRLEHQLHLDEVDPAPVFVAELLAQSGALEAQRREERETGRVLRRDARDEHVQGALARPGDQRLDELAPHPAAVVIAVDIDRDLAGEAEAELLHRRAIGKAEGRLLALGDEYDLVVVRLQPGAPPGITPGPLVEGGDAFQDLAVVDALDGGQVVRARWPDREGLCHALATFLFALVDPRHRAILRPLSVPVRLDRARERIPALSCALRRAATKGSPGATLAASPSGNRRAGRCRCRSGGSRRRPACGAGSSRPCAPALTSISLPMAPGQVATEPAPTATL